MVALKLYFVNLAPHINTIDQFVATYVIIIYRSAAK